MNTISHPFVSGANELAAKAKMLVLRHVRAATEARMRRVQYELQFRRSFDAYREDKGIPPLIEDLRFGS